MLIIKQLREQRGISIRKLAELTGITKSSLNDLENNRRMAKTQELELLSKALNVTEEELWRR